MKITNRHGIHPVFENFEKLNQHTTGGADISVTSLIDSPYIYGLSILHDDEIEEDISDRILAILGTAFHTAMAEAVPEGSIAEERLHASYPAIDSPVAWTQWHPNERDLTVSGQIDLRTPAEDGGWILSDYKTVNSYAVQSEPSSSWIRQLNCYADLARKNGLEVSGLEVIAVIRNWNNRMADTGLTPVVTIPIEMWKEKEADHYMRSRCDIYASLLDSTAAAMGVDIGGNSGHTTPWISPCTDKEKWATEPEFAVYEQTKSGSPRKRASKLFNSHMDAAMWIVENDKDKAVIVERPIEYKRCPICKVRNFCDDYNSREK